MGASSHGGHHLAGKSSGKSSPNLVIFSEMVTTRLDLDSYRFGLVEDLYFFVLKAGISFVPGLGPCLCQYYGCKNHVAIFHT